MARIKNEFYRRLTEVSKLINRVLVDDYNNPERVRISVGCLFPALFSLYSYLWSHKSSDLLKK